MANLIPNSFKQMLLKGNIAAAADTFNIILMQSGFIFDRNAHHAYADISASEIATAYGYTTGGAVLAGIALSIDTTNNLAKITWTDAQWNATGGTIAASGAIIYDDSTTTVSGHDYTDAIVAYIDAGGTVLAVDGTPMLVQNLIVEIS